MLNIPNDKLFKDINFNGKFKVNLGKKKFLSISFWRYHI